MTELERKTIKETIAKLQKMLDDDDKAKKYKLAKPEVAEVSKGEETASRSIDEKMIKEIFRELGIPAKCKGYKFMCSAVLYIVENPKKVIVTKKMYPDIAKEFGDNAANVEHNIRTCIKKMYEAEDTKSIEKVFGAVSKKGKMTNSEFLFGCAEYLKEQFAD